MGKRQEWLDVCKFLAIFLVVWGHVGLPTLLYAYIHAFHMPVFFFLSGYFFNSEKHKKITSIVKQRGKSILLPYFVFGLFFISFWSAVYFLTGHYDSIITPSEILKSMLVTNTTASPYNAVQWFLTCLFLTELIFFIIYQVSSGKKKTIFNFLVICALAGYLYPYFTNLRLFWGLDVALTAVVFYGFGFLVKKSSNKMLKIIYKPKPLYIIILFTISFITIYANGYVNMRLITYNNYVLFYFNAFAGIAILLMLSKYIGNQRLMTRSKLYEVITYLGRNTLIILVTHRFVERLMKMVLERLVITADPIVITLINLLCTVMIIVLMIPISKFMNRHFYFLLGKSRKNTLTHHEDVIAR